jgi:hypothetical protein
MRGNPKAESRRPKEDRNPKAEEPAIVNRFGLSGAFEDY